MSPKSQVKKSWLFRVGPKWYDDTNLVPPHEDWSIRYPLGTSEHLKHCKTFQNTPLVNPRYPTFIPKGAGGTNRHQQTPTDTDRHSQTPLKTCWHTLAPLTPLDLPRTTSHTPCHPQTHLWRLLYISPAVPETLGHQGVFGSVWLVSEDCLRSDWEASWSVWICLVVSVGICVTWRCLWVSGEVFWRI